MYLPAITLGYAVPAGDFDSSVHSVFHSALNLRLPEGGNLLTLVRSSEPDLPQGIRIDTPEGFTFENFRIDEPVICRDGILYFKDTALAVQLDGARRWDFDLSTLKIDTGNPAVSAAWSLVWETLNQRQALLHADIVADELFRSDKTKQSSVLSRAGNATRKLVNTTRQFDLAGASAAEELIGLGAGLTPSGDDLLAGYMAGLWCTAVRSDQTEFTTALGKRIIDLSLRTNDISRTYLFHAVQGQVSSRLTALAEAIGHAEDSDRLREAAKCAMQTGSTSGMDSVTGLLVGIATWNTMNW